MRLNHPIQKHITLNTINQIKFLNTIINRLSSNLKAIEKKKKILNTQARATYEPNSH